jgi:hypothetical protein
VVYYFYLDLYIYFGFPLARLKWRILLKSVRLPLQMPGGNAHEGVCIAAGVAAVGGCEQIKENGVCCGAGYLIGDGTD